MQVKNALNILFRADASTEIGTGHVMRCLTLADKLREVGHKTKFICRNVSGNLNDFILSRGHKVAVLEGNNLQEIDLHKNYLAHAHWLGTSQEDDASKCSALLNGERFDWLVVDHYGIDKVWQKQMRPHAKQICVIDDLADRHHECEILIDQNLGRSEQDYYRLVCKKCLLLIGPEFALLRDEFFEKRDRAIKIRRKSNEISNILISMGGADKDNVTATILRGLALANIPDEISLTVILGRSSPHVDEIQAELDMLDRPTKLLVGTDKMSELLIGADLAFGAAGSSSWERACLGLPTILTTIAANQEPAARALHNKGAAIWLGGHHNPNLEQLLASSLAILYASGKLSTMATQCFSLTDGRGAAKVADYMFNFGYGSGVH